jgi:Ca-activated chloride channel family protein
VQSQQAAPPAQGSAFRSGIDLVSLNVTVTDASNRYITDLSGDDFSILEDGVKQDIGFFSRTNLSLAVSLLLDSSASMEDKMRTTQAAALGFVQSLRPQDQAQVVDFDSRVSVAVPFTNSRADLEKAITSTVAGGSTSLYNAIYIALKELKKTQARSIEDLRRQAIIVLSDGEDTSSLVSYEEVLELAKRSETAIYAIGIRTREPGSGKGFNAADFVMRQLTTQTGGRVFFPTTVAELPAIYALISQELSSQYLIGYTSSNPRRDAQWRRIVVRASRPGTTARTKQGYYAPAS